mgnify:CR=1 FL=1
MRFDLVTLHPEILVPFASEGIIRGAQDKGLIEIHLHDVRLFSPDDGGIVDDRPFGGGAGMVMRPEPFGKAIEAISRQVGKRPYVVLLSAQGVLFTQGLAKELARQPAVALLCGRYEGVDERIAGLSDLELSIGDFVLAGGELAAAVVVETTARMVPGVVGRHESAATDSFFSGPRLGYPQYTRPRVFQGMEVPEVLLSGDHEKIRRFREREAWRKTLRHRPDLVGLTLSSPRAV